ncbi:hypothetical protein AAKU52_000679 [Pedobacter sp. CG_S7]|uniref:peptidoglycan-binding protein n=1 Tax=Pedobacter sp. CG_S7 TaxID=3143930 RepID=UPI003390CE5B
MAAVKFLLVIICFAVVGKHPVLSSNLLRPAPVGVIAIAAGELGVREATGRNDGSRVKAYLAAVGLKPGAPWCAAFVSWVFLQAGFTQPKTAWSPDLFPAARLKITPEPGLVFGIYFPELKRIAHAGFVAEVKGDWIITLEGNTTMAGSREGDGVYRKWRSRKTIHRFAEWRPAHD